MSLRIGGVNVLSDKTQWQFDFVFSSLTATSRQMHLQKGRSKEEAEYASTFFLMISWNIQNWLEQVGDLL